MKEYIEKTEAVERALYTPIMSSGAVCEKDRDAWTDGAIDAQEQIAKSIGEIPAADVVERKHGEWVSVEERLPRVSENVLVYSEFDGVNIGCLLNDGRFAVRTRWPDHPTHWMPLPEPPKEG